MGIEGGEGEGGFCCRETCKLYQKANAVLSIKVDEGRLFTPQLDKVNEGKEEGRGGELSVCFHFFKHNFISLTSG